MINKVEIYLVVVIQTQTNLNKLNFHLLLYHLNKFNQTNNLVRIYNRMSIQHKPIHYIIIIIINHNNLINHYIVIIWSLVIQHNNNKISNKYNNNINIQHNRNQHNHNHHKYQRNQHK